MHAKISHSFYKKDLLLKYQEQKQQKRLLQDRALTEARRVAGVLIEKYQAQTVHLFGPLSYGEFRKGMSIELAVAGMPHDRFAAALAFVKQVEDPAIELVAMAQVDAWTRRNIVRKGLELTIVS